MTDFLLAVKEDYFLPCQLGQIVSQLTEVFLNIPFDYSLKYTFFLSCKDQVALLIRNTLVNFTYLVEFWVKIQFKILVSFKTGEYCTKVIGIKSHFESEIFLFVLRRRNLDQMIQVIILVSYCINSQIIILWKSFKHSKV